MITLEYDALSGLVLPEGAVKSFVDNYIVANRDTDVHLIYSQELILDYFRLAIVRGELDHNIVQVKYLDNIVSIKSDGYLDSWPMPTYSNDVLSEILGW